VELHVVDDGAGAAGSRSGESGPEGGHGHLGMRERAALYGGAVDVGACAGGGYAVHAVLPIPERTQEATPAHRSAADAS